MSPYLDQSAGNITICSTPKPFTGHIGIIQRNAITSWTKLMPRPSIILLGNETGTAQICQELKLDHAPEIQLNDHGTPLVSSVFTTARARAKTKLVCYINADMLLLSDFTRAIKQLARLTDPFLAIGRRWLLDVTEPLPFDSPSWEPDLLTKLQRQGELIQTSGMDYFIFGANVWPHIPPMALGRMRCDKWLLADALKRNVTVIDTTTAFHAIHQNHTYHPFSSLAELQQGPEAQHNIELAGNARTVRIYQAKRLLTPAGFRPWWRSWPHIQHHLLILSGLRKPWKP